MQPQGRPPAVAGMSNFLDWILTSGTARVTLVGDHKRHGNLTDFYRPLRDRIVAAVGRAPERDGLDGYLAAVEDERANKIFPAIVAGWRKFSGEHVLQGFRAPHFELPVGPGVVVDVNPEIGARIDGTLHLVKLYLRGEALSQKRVDLSVTLMQNLDVADATEPVLRAVLDVRNARLRYLGKGAERAADQQRLRTLLRAEGAGYATAYAMV